MKKPPKTAAKKCLYCGKKITDSLFAPYCSRACVKAIAAKRGSNPDGSTSMADVARLAAKVRLDKPK